MFQDIKQLAFIVTAGLECKIPLYQGIGIQVVDLWVYTPVRGVNLITLHIELKDTGRRKHITDGYIRKEIPVIPQHLFFTIGKIVRPEIFGFERQRCRKAGTERMGKFSEKSSTIFSLFVIEITFRAGNILVIFIIEILHPGAEVGIAAGCSVI